MTWSGQIKLLAWSGIEGRASSDGGLLMNLDTIHLEYECECPNDCIRCLGVQMLQCQTLYLEAHRDALRWNDKEGKYREAMIKLIKERTNDCAA